MSTPKKRWFRASDSLGREEWSNDELAAVVRVMAEFNTRRARDGLLGDEAAILRLGRSDAERVSGKRRRDVALTCLSRLAHVTSMSIERDGDVAVITWRKFAKEQGWLSDDGEDVARVVPPPTPVSALQSPSPPSKTREGGGARARDAFDREQVFSLPGAFLEKLAADRPDLNARPGAVRCWLLSVVPKMASATKANGAPRYRRLVDTATNWWTRATRDELDAAVEREQVAAGFAAARAMNERDGGDEPPPAAGELLGFFDARDKGAA